jgi:hypothetical protein
MRPPPITYQILQELKGKIAKLVPPEHAQAVEDFVLQYQRVAGQLRALIYRALCPQLIKFNVVRVHSGLHSTYSVFHNS